MGCQRVWLRLIWDRSAVGIIQQKLKSHAEWGWKPGRPTGIDQPNLDHVSQMGTVLVPVAIEFHLHQGFELYDPFMIDFDRPINAGSWTDILLPNFAIREDNVQSLARFSIGAVQEDDGPHHLIANESDALKRVGGARQILLGKEQIHITRIADSAIVDGCHPRRDGVAADDRIRNLRLAQRLASPIQSFLNEFHGTKHPFENIEPTLTNDTG